MSERCEWITLHQKDEQLFGILHYPEVEAPAPAVMLCHGLGGNKIGRYRLYVHLARKLAEKGMIVLRLDFRGAGDSSGDLSKSSLEDQVSDAVCGLNFLINDPRVDKNRIGVFGRSLGGAIAIKAAEKMPSIASLALWAPVFSGHQWIDQWHHMAGLEGGVPPYMIVNGQKVGKPFLQQLIHLSLEEELTKLAHIPLLHLHGNLDEVVHLGHAERYEKKRQGTLGLTKFLRLPTADHDFTLMEDQTFALDQTTRWFEATLLHTTSLAGANT